MATGPSGASTRPTDIALDLSHVLPGLPLRLASLNGSSAPSVPTGVTAADAPGSSAGCRWVGAKITPTVPYFVPYTLDVTLSITPWSSPAAAQQAWAAEPIAPLTPPSGLPSVWSLLGVGDAARYVSSTPEDDQAVVEGLTGRFIFTVSLEADSEVFGQVPAPWVSLTKAVVSQLSGSPVSPSQGQSPPPVPVCQGDQLPDVGAPCSAPSPPALATCRVGEGSDISYPGGSMFDGAVDDAQPLSWGGIYAHIYSAPACADPASNPPTSTWVMLEAPKDSPHVFAQAGIFYGTSGQSPGLEHPFFEVDYPERPSTINGTVELNYPLSSGTFTVQVYAASSMPIPIDCGGGLHFGGCTTTSTEEIRFSVNGRLAQSMWIPSQYASKLGWADLAAEIHTTWSQFPGDCSQSLLLADAHVFPFNGSSWQGWDSSVNELDLPQTSGQLVRPGGIDVWTRSLPSC